MHGRIHAFSRVAEGIRSYTTDLQAYFAGEVKQEAADFICKVTDNPEISDRIIDEIRSEIPVARKATFWASLRMIIGMCVSLLLGSIYPDNFGSFIASVTISVCLAVMMAAHDRRFRHHYIANHLIAAIEHGLNYQSFLDGSGKLRKDPVAKEARNYCAKRIECAARRFPASYGRARGGGRFFAKTVRRKARQCRNDILTMIPGLAALDADEMRSINEDIARILIRTQLGYWYQTEDIAIDGVSIPLKYRARLGLGAFFQDRSIQVALIPFLGVIFSAILLFFPHAK